MSECFRRFLSAFKDILPQDRSVASRQVLSTETVLEVPPSAPPFAIVPVPEENVSL